MEDSVCRTTTALVNWASLCVNAKANDLSPDAPNFTAQIVITAQHGQVSINPDGTFGYTLDANFYGTDSFSYQYFYQYSNTWARHPTQPPSA